MIAAILGFAMRRGALVIAVVLALAAYGARALVELPVDALPDLSENQVIMVTDWPGHSPQEIEDQITRPLSLAFSGLAGVRAVRGTSELGWSMLHLLFDEGVEHALTRSRVAERLSGATVNLPEGIRPQLAPDSTAVGQVFAYTLDSAEHDLAELRGLQDSEVRTALAAVAGVAEVATVGGFVREIQIVLDPQRLAAVGATVAGVADAISRNHAVIDAGLTVDATGELLIRGSGLVRDLADLEAIAIVHGEGAALRLRDVATVRFGPSPRHAVLEKDGGEAVGGIIVMQHGADPATVIARVKRAIAALEPALPQGVKIVPFYDRTPLIQGAIASLRKTVLEEILIACLVVLLVLSHGRSALLISSAIPLSILLAFAAMSGLSLTSNIMSLTGIALSIGVLVDSAIVMTENAHHALRELAPGGDRRAAIVAACRTVARPVCCAVGITTLSIAPLFALHGPAGRLFEPLAWTKILVILASGVLAITWIPAWLPTVLRADRAPPPDNRLMRGIATIYRPLLAWSIRTPDPLLVATGLLLVAPLGWLPDASPYREIAAVSPFLAVIPIAWLARRKITCVAIVLVAGLLIGARASPLREEFMPQLDEGTLLDMPVTTPRLSVPDARDALLVRDALLRSFPEVASVVGKAGRAATATDPSPLEMFETIVNLTPHESWPARSLPHDGAIEWGTRVGERLVAQGVLRADSAQLRAWVALAVSDASERFDDFARSFVRARLAAGPPANVADIDRELWEHGAARFAVMLEEALVRAAGACDALIAANDAPTTATNANELAVERAPSLFLRAKTREELIVELDRVVAVPGFANIWTQPIINRIDMLATGVRSPLAIKLFAADDLTTPVAVERLRHVAARVARCLAAIEGAAHVFPEAALGEAQLEVTLDRERAARLGVAVRDQQIVLETAFGGRVIGDTLEGRRRVPLRLRLEHTAGEDLGSLRLLPVAAGDSGRFVALGDISTLRRVESPALLRSEHGSLLTTVALDVVGRDIPGFIAEARSRLAAEVDLPRGFRCEFSGRFETQAETRNRLAFVLPATLGVLLLLLWLAYRDLALAGIMALAVPGAWAGGVAFQAFLGVPFSLPVIVGYLASFGMASATAIVMLVYLADAIERRGGLHSIHSEDELRETVLDGAAKRLRPKFMTEATLLLGMLPLLFCTGPGAEIMRPMALPIVGGILVADEVIDLLVPVLYHALARRRWRTIHAG